MPTQDDNDMRRILEKLNKGDKMPIQKDRSKDLPGKTGWSWNDREKIIDVVENPEKYGVDINDTGGDDDKDGCFKEATEFAFLVASLSYLLHKLFS